MPYLPLVIWIVLTILFIVVEAVTEQLVSIWFSIGSLAAFVVALINSDAITVQIIVFVLVSALAFALTRPLAKKLTNKKIHPTNADRYIGAEAMVTEEINNRLGTGLVQAKGIIWTARSVDDSIIPKDAVVLIEEIEGVKLMVQIKA